MSRSLGTFRSYGGAACASALLAVTSLLAPVTAQADPVITLENFYSTGFEVIQPAQIPDLSGQFTLDVIEILSDGVTDGFQFIFSNNGPALSSITEIYFEDGFQAFLSFPSSSIVHSTGDPWSYENVSPGNVPGASSVNFTQVFAAESDPPPTHNGVRPGETLTLTFGLFDPFQRDDFLAALQSNTLRLAMHVTNQAPTGTSNSYLTTGQVAPVPPAFGLGLLGFATVGMSFLRKRKLATKA